MERAVALKRLHKMLGKGFAWRINPNAPSAAERESAETALPGVIELRNTFRDARDARYKELLQDEKYKALCEKAREMQERVEKLSGVTRHKKITVGTANGLFFVVKAEGDSWEDIFAKLKEG